MKNLSKKDYAIIGLFFLFSLASSAFATPAMILKDISYQAVLNQNPAAYAFSGIGYLMTLPVLMISITPIHLLSLFEVNVVFDSFYVLVPILTALIYSFILMFLLAMYNGRAKNKKSIKKI